MDQQQWEKLEEIFEQACDLPAGERERFVREACGDDQEMVTEVMRLLQHTTDKRASRIVGSAAEAVIAGSNKEGQRIGPYVLEKRLGVGGMGDVYLAERADGEFEQQVAIKLVHVGAQTEQVLARFRAERQILAQLKHANIAQLLDGGISDDGQPYFVMEYVDGVPLTEYCADQKLPIAERLTLFTQVCDAVTYAHAKLVIHRDLKPSNILVTADGSVKLLDFGIAKVLADEGGDDVAPLTRTGMSVMTPSYASPEQALGEPVGTPTDVYSLGVILFELVTGKRPYEVDNNNPVQAAEIICRFEPVRPSALAPLPRQFAGDVDVICLKALRKEPERRYLTANEFAADIRRLLNGQPVTARPDTLRYRTGKFIRRNRTGVVTALLMSVILVATVTLYTMRLAASTRESEAVTAFLVNILRSASPRRMGIDAKVIDAMDSATEEISTDDAVDPRTRAQIQHVLGATYFELTRFSDAETLLRESLEAREELFGPASREARITRQVLMELLVSTDAEQAEALIAEAKQYAPRTPDEIAIRTAATEARLLNDKGQWEPALAKYRELAETSRALLGESHIRTILLLRAVVTILSDTNQFDEAEQLLLDIIDRLERSNAEPLEISDAKKELAILYGNRQENDRAIPLMEDVLETDLALHGETNWFTAITQGNLAYDYYFVGRQEDAENMIKRSIATKVELLGESHGSTLIGYVMASQIIAKRDIKEGMLYCDKVISGAALAWPEGHWRRGEFNKSCADILIQAGQLEESLPYLLKAWEHYQVTPHPRPGDTAKTLITIRDVYRELGNDAEAERFNELSLENGGAELEAESSTDQPGA